MAFDELFVRGEVRSQYRAYYAQYSNLNQKDRAQALRRARATISGDADFLPLVRLLSSSEYRHLKAGVRQRGRVLRMFLYDHYFGGRSYLHSKILKRSHVEKILARYSLPTYQPALQKENIQFWYAPDIIRNSEGKFRVVEDNIGFVGAMGDLYALALAQKALGLPADSIQDPLPFYQSMVSNYKKQALRYGGGKVVLLSCPDSERGNHEDARLEKILSSLGVTTIKDLRTLKLTDRGIYHQNARVGFAIINRNCEDIDPAPGSRNRLKGFWQAVSAKKLGVSYAPGLEFVGDKEFCPSVEPLIEFYLQEKCLLPCLSTKDLSSAKAIDDVRRNQKRWVLKLSRSQGGVSVWIGNHLSPVQWNRLLKRVQKNAQDFIAQEFCEPSSFLGHPVDIRPLAVVSKAGVLVSPFPWGRAARNKKSKTNITSGGILAPIAIFEFKKISAELVQRAKERCALAEWR